MNSIHTLEARDNAFLELLSSHFNLSDKVMREEVWRARHKIAKDLHRKGVEYSTLRSSLTPQPNRHEVGLVFNTPHISRPDYGVEVGQQILPLLHRKQNLSILSGDLIHRDQLRARITLNQSLEAVRTINLVDTSQLYCVYINNLSAAAVAEITSRLTTYEPYVGHIPLTHESPTKDWISTTLLPCYVKSGAKFIGPHTDELPGPSNVNSYGWPLTDHNYEMVSIAETYFNLLLSYKIERAVKPGFKSDSLYALTAISETTISLEDCDVQVEDAKTKYLHEAKPGSMAAAGLQGASSGDLSRLIRSKIEQNYIYSLRYDQNRGQSFFNIVMEVGNVAPKFKLMVALEYRADDRLLRVVTMY